MKGLIEKAKLLTRKGDEFLARSGDKDFHQQARSLLADAKLSESYDFQQLVEASFRSDFSHQQNFSSFQFSDLPLTLAYGEHCFIDLYFWRRRPTVIHNHHFSGAFMCLEGSNLDFEYQFYPGQSFGRFHSSGSVELVQTRVIKAGDSAEIDFQDKFIHQNHHHSDLTINVCFRTPEKTGFNIANFLSSGLRFEKDAELLYRSEKLKRFLALGKFDFEKLELGIDDAIYFLIDHFGSSSKNTLLLKLKGTLEERVKRETGLDIDQLMILHEKKLDQLQEDYD